MTNYRNKQNYRFRTWKFRDRCHLKGGVRQGCFLSLILNYLIQYIHFHSLYIMSHYYAKFKENPCMGTDARTPFNVLASPCSGPGWFKSHFVGNPEARFSHVMAHMYMCVGCGCSLLLDICIFLMFEGPSSIGLLSLNKVFTYLLTYLGQAFFAVIIHAG